MRPGRLTQALCSLSRRTGGAQSGGHGNRPAQGSAARGSTAAAVTWRDATPTPVRGDQAPSHRLLVLSLWRPWGPPAGLSWHPWRCPVCPGGAGAALLRRSLDGACRGRVAWRPGLLLAPGNLRGACWVSRPVGPWADRCSHHKAVPGGPERGWEGGGFSLVGKETAWRQSLGWGWPFPGLPSWVAGAGAS